MAKILLAEDDAAIRDFVRLALEMDKHEVVAVHDGQEALERLLADADAYDLLLTDIRMPITDGVTLVQQIADIVPNLPVLVMTGYAGDYNEEKVFSQQVRGIITKPFTLESIRSEITSALAGGGKVEQAVSY
ncbi:MAG: response regulator [Methyloligellaceae bacterium]